jgi:DnaJ-class molecular chaperone
MGESEMTNNQEKLVPCPACQGNGYTIEGDPEVEGPVVDQCEMCDSQGEVEESYAKEWPFK